MVAEEADEGPQQRRGIIQGMKKMAGRSAQGTKKAFKSTKESTSKAVSFGKKKEDTTDENTPGSPGRGMSILSSSFDLSDLNDDSQDASGGGGLRSSSGSVGTTGTTKTLVVGPLMEFLTADATIIMVVAFAIAMAPTVKHYQAILDNQIPLSVAGSWVLLAYAVGQVFSVERWTSSHRVFASSNAEREDSKQQIIPGEIGFVNRDQAVAKEKEKTSHSLFLKFLSPKQREKISFRKFGESVQMTMRGKAWTTLKPNRSTVNPWENRLDPTKDTDAKKSDLMTRLLRNKKFRRAKIVSVPTPDADEVDAPPTSTAMGSIVSTSTAETLENIVIDPLLKLRGMDVFLTEDLETSVGTHPWLISQGLRDIPTFVVNVATPWGHALVYFEMPDWVKDFDPYDEEDSDPDDVKAFKRFLNGDQKYRNERLKVIPSIAEGPLAVKVLAPPKKEMLLNCALLPVTWQQYEPETTSTGRKLCPSLEVTLDCFSVRSMRSMAGIVKRNLKSLSIDIAAVIGTPVGQEEDEPQACLGLWRMDHIDILACPQMPDRLSKEAGLSGQDLDVLRATQLVRMSATELKELTASQDV